MVGIVVADIGLVDDVDEDIGEKVDVDVVNTIDGVVLDDAGAGENTGEEVVGVGVRLGDGAAVDVGGKVEGVLELDSDAEDEL